MTTSTSDADLFSRAERWAADDVDPATQKEVRDLLARSDWKTTDLADRFAGELEFGTAGLRGILGAGPNRMNRAVVLRATWGVAQHLLESVPNARERGVIIGYDGRRLSREFAEDCASVLAVFGIRALLATEPVPTPLTAFAVKKENAAAGIMVTASHNPPEYNGYKVYWENAAQIIPPTDREIARQIARAPSANRIERLPFDEARKRKLVFDWGPDIEEAYLNAILALRVHPKHSSETKIVFTALHGVGDKLVCASFARAGFSKLFSVPEQAKPDGAFPTVAFPNPEEKGSMDLSFAHARRMGADLVLANDPDADRLAVAIPDPSSATGYLQLTGNQVGILLGHYLLTAKANAANQAPRLVIASIVSSPMLGQIARALGVRYDETLTGFKWIANRAMELERTEQCDFVFGYEEALGYTVSTVVRDKDGISAALLFAELFASLRDRGKTVLDELESIYRRYGLYVSSQVNVTKKGATGIEEIRQLMDGLRKNLPQRIGKYDVVATSDYERQSKFDRAGKATSLSLPKSNVIAYDLEGGSRIIARPSGTEPKVKFYFDVREAMGEGEPLAAAEKRAMGAMAALSDAFTEHVVR